MTLSELVNNFLLEQRTIGQLLEPERVLAQAIAATQFYAGYGHIDVCNFVPPIKPTPVVYPMPDWMLGVIDPANGASTKRLIPIPTDDPLPPIPFDEVKDATEVSPSDWAIIRPLFILFCEREQALMLESSRIMGVDVFGRSSSEVQQDITALENDLPEKAFIQPAFSI